MAETNILMGWYSLGQHQTQAERDSLRESRTGSHLYRHEDGRAVMVTEVIPAGGSSRWPDATCVGRVTTYLEPGPAWVDTPVDPETKTREGLSRARRHKL